MPPPAQSDIPPRMKRDKKCDLSADAQAMPVSGVEGSSKSPPSNTKEKTAKAHIFCPLHPFTRRIQSPCTTNMAYWTKRWTVHIFQTPNGYFNPVEPAWSAGQQR